MKSLIQAIMALEKASIDFESVDSYVNSNDCCYETDAYYWAYIDKYHALETIEEMLPGYCEAAHYDLADMLATVIDYQAKMLKEKK